MLNNTIPSKTKKRPALMQVIAVQQKKSMDAIGEW